MIWVHVEFQDFAGVICLALTRRMILQGDWTRPLFDRYRQGRCWTGLLTAWQLAEVSTWGADVTILGEE